MFRPAPAETCSCFIVGYFLSNNIIFGMHVYSSNYLFSARMCINFPVEIYSQFTNYKCLISLQTCKAL